MLGWGGDRNLFELNHQGKLLEEGTGELSMKDKDETACEDSRKSIPSRGNRQCKGLKAESVP